MKKTNAILMLTAIFVAIFATACGAKSEPAAEATEAAQAPAQTVPINVPDTVANETYCVQKIPYQNILLDPGTTFQSADSELKCADSGTDVDGKDVITCTGKELWTYDLTLSNASGASSTIKVNMGGCPLPSN
ncbi:MAG: hypothetical protein IT310_00725 [Anaerolineales bacterium]|nr:hypothetical protein [Anaerolineales bacterium]